MAAVIGTTPEKIVQIGHAMGLEGPPEVTENQWRRSYITIIRRNWHLLPYDQLLRLLDWTEDELAYTLREDDFLEVKLGRLKPKCEPLVYAEPSQATRDREDRIRGILQAAFPNGVGVPKTPLFSFVDELSKPLDEEVERIESMLSPRFCYSYFALYGDPLLEPELDPFPEGLLQRLSAAGADGVWLQGVLFKLAPYPWDPELSRGHETRIENLKKLVAKAKKHGVGVYLYLNEPRSMPLSFFEGKEHLKGVVEGDYAAVCSSATPVQEYLRETVAHICRQIPDLAGFFTITASENLTNCWSHHQGQGCPRCSRREPSEVIAEVSQIIQAGIEEASSSTRLISWDWGWKDEWAEDIIKRLPKKVAHMSVSEWSIPIVRGGVESVVGEYSISEVGPGPRATRHWGYARQAGLQTLAKIQGNNTWEISTVPYIPAVENVARHAENLRDLELDGMMLGWTLGGHPSPNFEVIAQMGSPSSLSVDQAMRRVAASRYGEEVAPHAVEAWKAYSKAFSEYPYHIGVMYNGPQQMGPANPLWEEPTGYSSTMVGFPYDDLKGWRAVFSEEVFIEQFQDMAGGFSEAQTILKEAVTGIDLPPDQAEKLQLELDTAEVCALHFESVANQARFIQLRDQLGETGNPELKKKIREILESEKETAIRMHEIQSQESRFGFEASNHYFYVPIDLAEKVLNVERLMEVYR